MSDNLSGSDKDSFLHLRRCTRCILPETYPEIDFDDNGVCNYCRAHTKIANKRGNEEDLDRLFKSMKLDGEFDCVVPLSGGRDSTYVLHQIVRRYGLKPIAYSYDNGLMSNIAIQNIFNACSILRVKFEIKSSLSHSIARKYFLKASIKRSPLHFLGTLCYGCPNAIWGGALQLAREQNIPMIISGETDIEDAKYKKIQLESMHDSTIAKIGFLLRSPITYTIGHCTKKIFCQRYYSKETVMDSISTIRLFDYARYDENKVLAVLRDELDWESDKHTPWRFDCSIHNVSLLMTYQLMGMTEWDDFCSVEIREGMMTRDKALERISRFPEYRNYSLSRINEILDKMGLDASERRRVMDYVSQPPRLENRW